MKPLHRYSLLFDRRHCTTISIFFKLQTNSVFENLEELLELCDAGNSDFGRQELALLRSQERRNQDASAEMVEQSVGAGPFKLPATPRDVCAIVEILPVQMATLACAGLAGREPGRFRLLSKVTTTE